MKILNAIFLTSFLLLLSCNEKKDTFDAAGTFEAEETIISAEVTGKIKQLNIEEGQTIDSGRIIGYIDSTQLVLKKEQLYAQINALASRKPNVTKQLATLKTQLASQEKEKNRIEKLVQGNAAPRKQLDDINAALEVTRKQIEAQHSTLSISTKSIQKELLPLKFQIYQLNDQLNKCRIINPMQGTILTKYAKTNEITTVGKPLYKIADLRQITLKAYITGNQLAQAKLNQTVRVLTDDGKGGMKETTGTIVRISDKAEFTPKTIQTKDERANLVYAVKVKVENDGFYKIGMYGEIKF